MANHLHWYTGGTIGAADGEEVDISSPFSLGTCSGASRRRLRST